MGTENPYPPRRDSLNSSAAAAAMIQQQQQPPPNPKNTRIGTYQRYNDSSPPPISQSPPQTRFPSTVYAPPQPTQEISNGPRRSSSPAPPVPPPKDEVYPLAHSPHSSLGFGVLQPQQQKASPAVSPAYTATTTPAQTLSAPPPPSSSAAAPNSSYNSSRSTTTTTVTTTTPYSTTTTFFPLPINEQNQSPPPNPPEQSTNDNNIALPTPSSSAALAAATATMVRYNQLPPIQTGISAQNLGERREQREQQQLDGSGVFIAELGGGRVDDDEDEEIVMSSTSYPGQEWTPSRYERWDGD